MPGPSAGDSIELARAAPDSESDSDEPAAAGDYDSDARDDRDDNDDPSHHSSFFALAHRTRRLKSESLISLRYRRARA
jgi:hypothetical protein